MATKFDSQIIEDLGGVDAVVAALGFKKEAVKKWPQKKRGIPWRARARIKELAEKKGVKLPADFLSERRVTA